MKIYRNLKELQGNTLMENDEVHFGIYEYIVRSDELRPKVTSIRSIFEFFEIDKNEFMTDVLGYKSYGNSFPRDFIGLTKLAIELFKLCEKLPPVKIYRSFQELKGNVLSLHDQVHFGELRYVVYDTSLDLLGGNSRKIFNILKIHYRYEFASLIYGYEVETGDWPNSKEKDFVALTKLTLELFKMYEEQVSSGQIKEDEEKEKEVGTSEEEDSGDISLNPDGFFVSKFNPFVLGRFAPDPEVTFNYCPIMWLTALSFILLTPVLIFKIFKWTFIGLYRLFNYLITESLEDMFFESFNDIDKRISYSSYNSKLPWYVQKSRFEEYLSRWFREESGSTGKTIDELRKEIDEIKAKRKKEIEEISKRRKENFSWKLPKVEFTFHKRISDRVSSFVEKTKDTVAAQKMLIKYTQRFFGLLITGVLAAASYFLVHLIVRFFIWIVDIWDGTSILIRLKEIGMILLIVGLVIGVIALLIWFFKWLYKSIPSNSLFYKAVKYIIVMPFYYMFYGFVWKFVCVTFLWELLCKMCIFGLIMFMVDGFIGAGKIIGMYFGKTKKATCPGVKWVKK